MGVTAAVHSPDDWTAVGVLSLGGRGFFPSGGGFRFFQADSVPVSPATTSTAFWPDDAGRIAAVRRIVPERELGDRRPFAGRRYSVRLLPINDAFRFRLCSTDALSSRDYDNAVSLSLSFCLSLRRAWNLYRSQVGE